ncbi:uncharacterized protein LOC122376179 [Amphibalanus amphitrite]|uniref:uncharacterized protein LOC122376179 n=1 Tax=Amphibalanus amphitrite TaxID=1232801 RepID=UPI001C923321|nr:uncharacterized protein LOC122376179 [Amphibalanus amphitrite]
MRGVQAAVALRRQRSRREERQRRLTNSSLDSATPRTSLSETHFETPAPSEPSKSRSILFGITLFHIGLVLLFIGFLLVITAMIPRYSSGAKAYDLAGTGTFFVVLGGVMTLLNRVISRREDDSLEKYVSGRLARSKSGGRLVRDSDSGLTPDVHRRGHRRASRTPRSPRSPAGGASTPASLDAEQALTEIPEETPAAAAGLESPAGQVTLTICKDMSGDSQVALLSAAEPRDMRVVLTPPASDRQNGPATSV